MFYATASAFITIAHTYYFGQGMFHCSIILLSFIEENGSDGNQSLALHLRLLIIYETLTNQCHILCISYGSRHL